MSKKIVLLNTWHNSYDDRVFYHQAKSLAKSGYEVLIISTKEEMVEELGNITVNSFNGINLNRNDKTKKIIDYLEAFSPVCIICDSPLAVTASYKYKKNHPVKIVYDITEWYPSKIHLQYTKGFRKLFRFFALVMVNLSAGLKSDSFIFGEYYKSIEYRILFCWKPFARLPYYPDISYIQYYPLEEITTEINLLYSGKINADKGIDTVIKAIKLAAGKCPEIQFKLKIIGNFPTMEDQSFFSELTCRLTTNIHISIVDSLPFPEFCNTIGDTHLFFDLRKRDFENTHCLPIKLFYYLGCGRPVIYSDLKAIRKEVMNINFGYLCNPNDIDAVAGHIKDYINQPGLYTEHATNALTISKTKYNWNAIENDFISFIESQSK
jgi:glycosyltransferase involved in cell wall biosynthesis